MKALKEMFPKRIQHQIDVLAKKHDRNSMDAVGQYQNLQKELSTKQVTKQPSDPALNSYKVTEGRYGGQVKNNERLNYQNDVVDRLFKDTKEAIDSLKNEDDLRVAAQTQQDQGGNKTLETYLSDVRAVKQNVDKLKPDAIMKDLLSMKKLVFASAKLHVKLDNPNLSDHDPRRFLIQKRIQIIDKLYQAKWDKVSSATYKLGKAVEPLHEKSFRDSKAAVEKKIYVSPSSPKAGR